MHIDTLTLVALFALLGAMLWDIHRGVTKISAQTEHIAEIARDIARFLGTDRR